MNPYTDFGFKRLFGLEANKDLLTDFLKNLENFDHIPNILNEPVFEKAFHISEIGAMNKSEYDTYQESLLSYWESKGIVDTARAEGKEEGAQLEKISVARNAIQMGLTDEMIQHLTALSIDEIQKLRDEQK